MSYNKKVWKSGDRITKEALNNMENGIETAHQNSGGTGSVAIVDNLNSNSSTSALSAKQGKELNNKMPAKSIVEGGKIYLAKEDGTKIDSGTELPAGGSTIEVVNNLESDSTTAALSAAQGKALNTQYKDIANYSLVKHTDGKVYIKKQDGTLVGSGVEVGSDTDLSKVTMNMSGQTLKLLNNGAQIATVEIPTAVVTDEQLTSIIQSKIDDGTLSALSIEDNSLSPSKIEGTIVFKNYFDVNSCKSEGGVGYLNNGITNSESYYYHYTHYIKLNYYEKYTIKVVNVNLRSVAYYDLSKTYIKTDNLKDKVATITLPPNTQYIRFDTTNGSDSDNWCEGIIVYPLDNIPDNIVEYYELSSNINCVNGIRNLDGNSITENTIDNSKLKDYTIERIKIKNINIAKIKDANMKNLFDKDEYVYSTEDTEKSLVGYFLAGKFVIDKSYRTLILRCLPNTKYYFYRIDDEGNCSEVAFNNLTLFGNKDMQTSQVTIENHSFTTPEDCCYILCTIGPYCNTEDGYKEKINRIMLTDYGISETYYPYVAEPKWLHTKRNNIKLICYGDSLTQNKYPKYIRELLNCVKLTDAGISGNVIKQINSRVGTYGTDYNVVTFMIGTNDNGGATSCNLGTKNDTTALSDHDPKDTEVTFHSRVKLLIETIKSTHKGALIIGMSFFQHEWMSKDAADAISNAIKEECNLYRIPYLDVLNLVGWDGTNSDDRTIYMSDNTHENEVGAKRLAELITGEIKRLKGI